MGRFGDPVRSGFHRMKGTDGRWKLVCTGCGETVSDVASRLRGHTNKCEAARRRAVHSDAGGPLAESFKRRQAHPVQKALANLVYTNNLPFTIATSKSLHQLVKFLAPGVSVPSIQKLRGPLLDEAFNDLVNLWKARFGGQMCTLSLDGWTSPDGWSLLGVALGRTLVALRDDPVSHTAEELERMAVEEIGKVEEKLGAHVVGVVTDNAANMKACRRRLTDCVSTFLFAYRCQVHALHGVFTDFFKDAGRLKILKAVTEVLKSFREVHVLAAALRAQGLPRPTLPGKTRWGSTWKSLSYYNLRWAFLAQYAATNLPRNHAVRMTLESSQV